MGASADATLSALVVNDGTNDRTLDPTFAPGTFDYDADVGNAVTTVTLTATVNNSNASVTGVTLGGTAIADTDFTDGITVPSLAEDDNEIVVTVTAEDTTTEDYTVTVSRARRRTTTPTPPDEVEVPNGWSLIPTGLAAGDKFRLLFLSSTNTDGTSYDIADYNTFVQGRAAAGHTDIQAYSSAFRAVGCTSDSDATANTGAYNSAGTGVPIHWLNGNKVADDYADFYDGSWDDEANDKNELGDNGPDTSQTANFPLTGCQDYGEEAVLGGRTLALGQPTPRVGRPNSSASGSGPIHSLSFVGPSDPRPMYGLSQVFEVGAPTDVTLRDLELEGATGGETILLSPAFDSDTETYTASVANRIAAVTLTATKNDTTATVAITSDDDTSTEGEAELDLNVGSNTLTVTVTAEDATPKTYTITVTRAAAPPAPTDCPADTDWCTTLGVGYAIELTAMFKVETWGYRSHESIGDLLSTTFSHGGTSYTVSELNRNKLTQLAGNTVTTDNVSITISPALPDGTVLQLGNRTFTVDTDSATHNIGQELWDLLNNPLSWTAGQHVTVSLKFPTAPNQPTGLTATAVGGTQINLAWVAPTDNGGATISGYRIEVSADGGTNWTDLLATTGTTSVTYSHTGLTRGSTRHYRVSAINAVGTGAASDPASATTATPTPPAPVEITVPNDWSLIPTGLSTGDKFRLIFLSSTKRNAGSTDIVDYNSFIQGRAAAGHTDIQTYSAGFRAVGCTADSDARDNTATTGTSVVIYWLNGNKAADNYGDFYDGSWDDEANDKEEDGTNGPDTTMDGNFPWTGCEHNGTEATFGSSSRALGTSTARVGIPNSSVTNNGPLSSATNPSSSGRRPMYGISQVFEVAAAANTAATGTPSIVGTPQVGMVLTAAKGTIADADGTTKADNGDTGYAYSYQWVRVDGGTDSPITSATASTYTLTATDLGKTIKVQTSFTDDGDTAEGPLTSAATVAVLAVAVACPTDNDWCTTLTVEFRQQSPSVHYYGYIETFDTGALGDRTINYGGRNWRLDALYIEDDAGIRTIRIEEFFTNGFLPRGSVFNLGGQDFTATATAEDFATKIYSWPVPASMAWIDGQKVTVSVTLANFAATGTPVISGTAQVGETLMAAIGNIADTDGLPSTFPDDYTFQWLRRDGGTDSPITGATASTYTPVAADVGKKVKVTVSFTDDAGTGEDRTSDAYPSSGRIVLETLPALSFAPTLVTVDEDAGSATLTVELDLASTGTVTVDYATRDLVGGAIAGDDYTATSGTLTFAATETSKTITVPILNDDVYENALEAFSVDLSNPSGATLPDPPSATVRIDSEDAVPTASMAPVTVDEGAGTMTLTLRLSHPSSADIAYVTSVGNVTGTATEGDDYDDFLLGPGRTAKITVPGGSLSQTFDITLVDDGVDEADETIVIVWRKSIGDEVTPSTFTFTGTIVPEPLPALSFAPSIVDVDEDAGSATLTVELTPASTGTVTVDYATRDSFAKAGEDYTATSGTLTFTAGQTSKTFTVPITDDDVYENNEAFFVDLSNPTGATLPDPPSAVVRIDSEDAAPTASMTPVTVDEGAGTMTLTLRLSHPSDAEIAYFTIYDEDIATGTATEGDDYDDFLLGPARTARITVPAGDLSQTFDITVVNDSEDEPDETIIIVWNKNSNSDATPASLTFTGTITDNDTADNNPTVRFGATSYTAIEGVAGAVVTVELNPAAARAVTILVTATPQGGASSADYSGVPGSVTFAAGETEKSFTVRATDDSADDDGESVQLGFGRLPAGVALGSPATATVALVAGSGVSTWYVWFGESSYTVTEGGTARISVHLNSPWKPERNEALTVPLFDPQHRGGASADDYSGLPESVTFQPGQTRTSFTVRVTEDSEDDDGESVLIGFRRLFPDDLEVGRYGPHKTTLHIADNDGEKAVTVSFDAANYTAAEGGATATVRVRLDAAPGRSVTIELTKTHRGATAADYSGLPGSVTFGASETEKSFTVTATDDSLDDDRESVAIGFGSLPSKVSAGSPSEAVVQLTDNDHAVPSVQVRFDASAGAVRDGVEEGGSYRLGVRLSVKPGVTLTIPLKYAYLGGATAADFSNLPANVTFAKNVTSAGVTIRPVDDFEEDPGESLKVSFGTLPAGVSVGASGRSTSIPVIDNDALPGLSVADASAREWPNPLPCLIFVVTMDRMDVDHEVRVDYATRSGTAVAGQDFTPIAGTLVFRPSESRRRTASKRLCVKVLDDAHDEGVEEMTLVLSNPVRASLVDGTATGWISNTDKMPRASMARFGRTAAVHVVERVEERMAAPREVGFEGQIAGRQLRPGMEREIALDFLNRLGASAGAQAPDGGSGGVLSGAPMATAAGSMGLAAGPMDGMAGTDGGLFDRGLHSLGLGGENLLTGSSFAFNRETRQGGMLSFWSRGARSSFAGREGALRIDGDVRTTMFGTDYAKGSMVAGLSLAHTRGRGGYRGLSSVSSGEVASAVTGLYPWLGYTLSDRVSVWGVTGYGKGALTLTPGEAAALSSGLSMAMAAGGVRGELADSVVAGFGLAFKADALWVGTVIDGVEGPGGNLAAARAAVTRFRTGLEASRGYRFERGLSLQPSLELGIRRDGGDAETGAGVDIGGGLVVSDRRTGLSADVRVRMLLAHQDEGFSERGMSIAFSFDPTPSTPLGFMAKMTPSWGGQATAGAQALWGQETMAGMSQGGVPAGSRLEAELGYGMPVWGRLVGTPRFGIGASEYGRDYRLGYGLTVAESGAVSFELGIDAARRESPVEGGAEHGVQGRLTARW